MRSYRTAMALAVLLLLPTWVSADPAEEQAIKQADKPTPVVQSFHGCPARGHGLSASPVLSVCRAVTAPLSSPKYSTPSHPSAGGVFTGARVVKVQRIAPSCKRSAAIPVLVPTYTMAPVPCVGEVVAFEPMGLRTTVPPV